MSKEVYQVFTMSEGDSYFALVKKEHFEWVFGENEADEALIADIWKSNTALREQFSNNYEEYKNYIEEKSTCRTFNRALVIPPIKIGDEEARFNLYSKIRKFKDKYGLTIKEIGDYI